MPDPAPDPPPDSDEWLAPGVRVRKEDLAFTFVRGSGPGGQAVNKLSTAAQMRVAVAAIEGLDGRAAARLRRLAGRRLTSADEVLIQARAHRSQRANRRACLAELRALVAAALRPPRPRRKTKPTKASIERRLTEKRKQSEKKDRRKSPDDEKKG